MTQQPKQQPPSREEKIAAIVAKAPPLTDAQKAKLRPLLNLGEYLVREREARVERLVRDHIARRIADDQ
jgi:hypothetical protein